MCNVCYEIAVWQDRHTKKQKGRGTINADFPDLYRLFGSDKTSLKLECGEVVDFFITQLTATRYAPIYCEIVVTGRTTEI